MTIEERRERRRARPHSFDDTSPLDALPPHAPLYAALFTSIAAVAFSICAHRSTSFVKLEEPLELSPYLRNVDHVGLSAWEVCALRQEALDGLVSDGSADDGEADDASTTGLSARVPLWTAKTATDVQRDVSSTVRTTYHPAPDAQSKGWMQEPDHDDVLVSADYPYNDDDAYEMALPDAYWECHRLQITSASARHDGKWNLARAFFMAGSICGVVSTLLLGTLIVRRGREARRRRRSGKDRQRKLRRRQSSQMELLGQTSDATSQPYAGHTNDLLLLDTNYSGYRPISICFVAAYLLQSLTLLFLSSQLCRNQACSLSSGGHYLLIACVLWIASGVLVLTMFRQVRDNERRVRLFKRKMDRKRARDEALQRTNSDAEEDAESLLPINASMDDDHSSDDAETHGGKQIDEESELNTTADTECSECSASTTQEGHEEG